MPQYLFASPPSQDEAKPLIANGLSKGGEEFTPSDPMHWMAVDQNTVHVKNYSFDHSAILIKR
jgi:hypothetical protein